MGRWGDGVTKRGVYGEQSNGLDIICLALLLFGLLLIFFYNETDPVKPGTFTVILKKMLRRSSVLTLRTVVKRWGLFISTLIV
jgi:hypothetical protein